MTQRASVTVTVRVTVMGPAAARRLLTPLSHTVHPSGSCAPYTREGLWGDSMGIWKLVSLTPRSGWRGVQPSVDWLQLRL